MIVSDYASKLSKSAQSGEAVNVDRPSPGKTTLVQRAQTAAEQPAASRGDGGEDHVHAAAQAGIAGPSQQLPHLEAIQRLFGPHDVRGVHAHVGGPADKAARAMGATAYATGNAVAFAATPDLHTAAHEAAHVVQQRGGVQLAGGVGQVGDPHERNADAVADRVVRGETAVDLLPAAPAAAVATSAVQRQIAAPDPLSAGQAAMAVSFYRGQPDLYPADVITKIQHAVHTPETGTADPAMAQGVGRFQQSSFLKVDGMAGPRTLPRLFESGLATKSDRAQFVTAAKAVEAAWTTLATPKARADKLFEGVKPLLDAEKVPTPSVELGDLGKAAGVFESRPWRITFDRTALSAANISDDDARSLSATVYHESRHAEQHAKMARMLATKGNTAQQIRAKMGIPIEVAEAAFANKLPKGVEYATASQQFDAEFGAGKAHHQKAESEAPSAAELRAAQAAVAEDPSPQNKAKLARLTAAFKAYHDLPVENDAFATETDFEESWDEATAAP